jgi:putative FmdB family regulatory protein
MPIYAYKCASCGHAKDVLQKISDAPLTTCPACGAEAFSKQLTAAGFQLKGSGWYVTDFRGGGAAAASAPAAAGAAASATPATASAAPAASGGGSDSGASASAGTPCGGSCACH